MKICTSIITIVFLLSSIGISNLSADLNIFSETLRPLAASHVDIPDSIKRAFSDEHDVAPESIDVYEKSPYFTLPQDKWELKKFPDIDDTGTEWAALIINYIAYFQYDKGRLAEIAALGYGADVPRKLMTTMQTNTGDTPWPGYKKYCDIMDLDWNKSEVRRFLSKIGVDPEKKPVMKYVEVVALDAIFPQKRDTYHSFPNILKDFYDEAHIPDENRHFFYGDLTIDVDDDKGIQDAKPREMTTQEFDDLWEDIQTNGFWLDEFVVALEKRKDPDFKHLLVEFRENHALQYRHFLAMWLSAKNMSKFLRKKGGADIYLYGIGPSDKGAGHMGFNEAGVSIGSSAFIASIIYHIAAGHAKEVGRGGMGDLLDQIRMSAGRFEEKIYKYGLITYSYSDFLRNKDAIHLIIATGDSKSSSVYQAIEGALEPDPQHPVSVVVRSTEAPDDPDKPKNAIIVDANSSLDLRIARSPYEFKVVDEWTEHVELDFMVKLSMLTGVAIRDLEIEDFLDLSPDMRQQWEADPDWIAVKQKNLRSLILQRGEWDEIKKRVSEKLGKRLCTPKFAADRIVKSVERPDDMSPEEALKMLILNPHPDDEFLATLGHLLRDLVKKKVKISTYYTSEGYTAVNDGYVISILKYIREHFDGAELKVWLSSIIKDGKVPEKSFRETEKSLCEDLVKVLKKQPQPKESDWVPWERTGAVEKALRARLTLLRLVRMHEGRLNSKETLDEVIGFIIDTTLNKEIWGNADLDEMKILKTGIRATEAKTALMYCGIEYENVNDPLPSTSYGEEGRETGRKPDLELIKRVISNENPDIIMTNGERFSDLGSHSTTEALVAQAIIELIQEEREVLDDGGEPNTHLRRALLVQYAGVWHRTSQDEEGVQLSIVMSEGKMDKGIEWFKNAYASQELPGVPYSGDQDVRGFGQMVKDNAQLGKVEARTLGIKPLSREGRIANALLHYEGSGVLNFKMFQLGDEKTLRILHKKGKLWEEVGDTVNASSNKVWHGSLDDKKPVRPKSIPRDPRLILTESVRMIYYSTLQAIDSAA
ncbi:hypothetical protein ACFL0T_01445 [Candidatus Omnitrophota bacterium]